MKLFGEDFSQVPRVIVFDVDFTLWPFWVDTHVRPPFSKNTSGIVDSRNKSISLYESVPKIFQEIIASGIPIGLASRTDDPEALEALARLTMINDNLTLWNAAAYREVLNTPFQKDCNSLNH